MIPSRTRLLSCSALVVVFATHAPRVVAQSLVGVRWDDGSIHAISTTNSATTSYGFTSAPHLVDLIRASDGYLYSIVTGASPALLRYDPVTGSTQSVGPLGVGPVFEGALAFSAAGVVYGFSAGDPATAQLFQVDLATGAASSLVALSNPPHQIHGATFRSDGVLMAIDGATNALVTIDPANGATQSVRVLNPIVSGPGGLTTVDGTTYFTGATPGQSQQLFRIDLFTGDHVFVRDLGGIAAGGGISGLATAPDAPGTLICFGDGAPNLCPCGNSTPTWTMSGCANSTNVGGALRASGTPSVSNDTLLLRGSGLTGQWALYFQGTTHIANWHLGDGMRCVAGAVYRLGTKLNSAGSSRYPGPGDASVSVRGNVLPGAWHKYQVWYRNAAAFCTPETSNTTNALEIHWSP